jgi:hypothetical protein
MFSSFGGFRTVRFFSIGLFGVADSSKREIASGVNIIYATALITNEAISYV